MPVLATTGTGGQSRCRPLPTLAPPHTPPMSLTLGTTAGRSLRGTVRVPGDKSISHRALLFGAIAEGSTRIEGLLPAEDPLSTAACLRAMGVEVSPIAAGQPVLVQGVGLDGFREPEDVLDCGNSGTTMRLMLGLLAGRDGRHFVLNGDGSLRRRPPARRHDPHTGGFGSGEERDPARSPDRRRHHHRD